MGTTTNRRTRALDGMDWVKLHAYLKARADAQNIVTCMTAQTLADDVLRATGVDVNVRGIIKNCSKLGYTVVSESNVNDLIAEITRLRSLLISCGINPDEKQ